MSYTFQIKIFQTQQCRGEFKRGFPYYSIISNRFYWAAADQSRANQGIKDPQLQIWSSLCSLCVCFCLFGTNRMVAIEWLSVFEVCLNCSPDIYTYLDATPSHELGLRSLLVFGAFSRFQSEDYFQLLNVDGAMIHNVLLCHHLSSIFSLLVSLFGNAEARWFRNMKSMVWWWLALLSFRPWKAFLRSSTKSAKYEANKS